MKGTWWYQFYFASFHAKLYIHQPSGSKSFSNTSFFYQFKIEVLEPFSCFFFYNFVFYLVWMIQYFLLVVLPWYTLGRLFWIIITCCSTYIHPNHLMTGSISTCSIFYALSHLSAPQSFNSIISTIFRAISHGNSLWHDSVFEFFRGPNSSYF